MKAITIIQKGYQRTINSPFIVKGISPFQGNKVKVICYPAKIDTGVVFRHQGVQIKAVIDNLKPVNFHTTVLQKKSNSVLFVEHILSAFFGMRIDNIIIELHGDFCLPLLDGSSLLYVKKIIQVGIRELNKKINVIKINKPLVIFSKKKDQWCILIPNSKFKIRADIDFDNIIGKQDVEIDLSKKNAYRKIAGARTFFKQPYSKSRYGLLCQMFKSLPKDPRKSEIIIYDEKDYMQRLRYPNEPVRHKVLDVLGDLSLSGYRFQGIMIFHRPSHKFTHYLVKKMLILAK